MICSLGFKILLVGLIGMSLLIYFPFDSKALTFVSFKSPITFIRIYFLLLVVGTIDILGPVLFTEISALYSCF